MNERQGDEIINVLKDMLNSLDRLEEKLDQLCQNTTPNGS